MGIKDTYAVAFTNQAHDNPGQKKALARARAAHYVHVGAKLRRCYISVVPRKGPSIAEIIRERRRCRLEASGQPDEDLPSVDYTGCRTIADHILRARRVRMEHCRTRSDA